MPKNDVVIDISGTYFQGEPFHKLISLNDSIQAAAGIKV